MSETEASVRHGQDDGVSLVEVMVAMGVFVAASLALLGVLSTSVAGTFDNRARVTAAQVAASDIDTARAKGASDYYGLTSQTYDEVVDGRTYTVTRTVDPTLSTGTTSSCIGSGSARQLYKRVTTKVTTPGADIKAVRADTMVKAPVYDPNSSTGAIGLVVIDRAGDPLSGLAANAGGLNRTTDAKGCAFFDGLAAGTHTATVTRSGSVTIAGSSTLSRSVGVSAGQITSAVLRVDTAATLTVDSSRCCSNSSSFTRPDGLAITLSSPDRGSATRVDYPSQAVTGTTQSWSVFPSPAGYEAYLGQCPTPKRIASEPGTTPPLTLIPTSTVRVRFAGPATFNTIARSRGVVAFWTGSGCSQTLTWATTLTRNDCRTNESEVNDGCFVYVALPPGSWRFEMQGHPQHWTALTVAESQTYQININLS